MAAVPSQTLYLNNLTEQLSKEKLRRQLFNLCTKFGSVLDVAVQPGNSMRGQAWVVFSSIEAATKALNRLNGYEFFQKPIKAQFARENSDVVLKLQGKAVPKREKKPEKEARTTGGDQDASAGESGRKRVKTASEEPSGGGHDSNNPPGPLLKIDNIPEGTTQEDLIAIFSKYDGYLDIRYVASKQLAFVEYRTTEHAKVAREGLRGFQITPSAKLRVNFAKPRDS